MHYSIWLEDLVGKEKNPLFKGSPLRRLFEEWEQLVQLSSRDIEQRTFEQATLPHPEMRGKVDLTRILDLIFNPTPSVLGRPGKDRLDREAMPTLLVTTKRRSQERKEGLEPSTSALARLCSTIKLFPPATVVAKHY
ncbi:hypothetical protein Lal_00015570 [Lupinus albus]|nr:hypothetical protein Lal_00015570 [Lupinus albus]